MTTADIVGVLETAVPVPLVIDAVPGEVRADLAPVTVDGEESAVSWDGGRPFALEGSGSLRPGLVGIVFDGRYTIFLASGRHALGPGDYVTTTPVAVGRSGLARPADGVAFTVTDRALLAIDGEASTAVTLPTAVVLGPGSATLRGRLTVTTAAGVPRDVTEFSLEDGRFEIRIETGNDGRSIVDALVEGNFSTA